jgi:3-oxoadipate enol-lactonase
MNIHANGIAVNYELSGPDNAPVVMLCHSLSATLGMWDAQMAALTERYRVLRYDLRGHGASEAPGGDYRFDMLADDALSLLRALKISRCHFVGLSIGGMIGQALGIRGAAEIASLALCATSSRVPTEMHSVWDARVQQARTQGMASLSGMTLERWFTTAFRANRAAELARVGAMISNTSVNGFAGCASAIKMLNFTDRLRHITLPTLLIAGRDDPSTPVAASEVIQREIAASELVVLEDAMHLCNIEQPEGFNRALLAFLNRQD